MISKDNRNVMITLSKSDLKKLEEYTKQKSKEIGVKLTKSQVISMFILEATGEAEKPVVREQIKRPYINPQRTDTMRPKSTKDMSLLQQMINYLNYDCGISYARIGGMLNPNVSERSIKDYMYGKIKNPSEDKIYQLKKICSKYGKKF
ncbi:MAG: hypothetical protein K6E21_03675 [Bacilli bacterium]|nr:hypothetical protein [Bacilli bacterium]